MILESLVLTHYRNYEKINLNFGEGLHIITGLNAQGKTNLLEAILYLSTIRSHRGVEDELLIQEGYEFGSIEATIHKGNRHEDLKVILTKQGKNLFIYKTPIRKVSDFIGECNAVMFCPDDMVLFQTSPKVRRKFIDIELTKLSKNFTHALMNSYKLLKERNAYLKQDMINTDYLEILNERLIGFQVIVLKQRFMFLKELMKQSENFYRNLSNDTTILSFRYESCLSSFENEEDMINELKLKYKKNEDRDRLLKQTTIGFHKDDILFMIDGKEIENVASQGQKRSALLAMKLGIVNMIRDVSHEYPILLLDDVFSELDKVRCHKLLEFLPSNIQVFISATHIHEEMDDIDRDYSCWKVDSGKVENVRRK